MAFRLLSPAVQVSGQNGPGEGGIAMLGNGVRRSKFTVEKSAALVVGLAGMILIATGSPAFATHPNDDFDSATVIDCATDPSALASALASATDGDTLAIQGTCQGTFEIASSLTLAGSAGATL